MAEEVGTEATEFEHHELHAFAGVEPRFRLPSRNFGGSFLSSRNFGGSFLSTFSASSCVISHTPFARKAVYAFVLLTCAPLVAGVAFTDICLVDGNYHAAVQAFFTACLAIGTLSLFILHLIRKMDSYHDTSTLEGIKGFSMIMSVVSGISLGIYTILAFFNKESFNLHGKNYYSSAVFSGITLATSIELYVVAQWYQNALQNSADNERVINSHSLGPTSAVIN